MIELETVEGNILYIKKSNITYVEDVTRRHGEAYKNYYEGPIASVHIITHSAVNHWHVKGEAAQIAGWIAKD